MAIGAILLVLPGPGLPILLLGGGLIARESALAARVLDWAEVRLRAVVARGFHLWQQAPSRLKIALLVLALGAMAGMSYTAYRLLF